MPLGKKSSDYQDNFNDSSSREIYSHSKGKKTHRIQLGAKTLRNRKIILSFAIILSIFVGLLGATFIYAYNMLDSLNYKPLTSDYSGDDYISGSAQDPMVLNVALFGVDKHDAADSRSRSDSLMILSLDSRRKKIKVTSIMRDLWVQIPGYRDNRVNTAIAIGGEPLMIKTIEHNFGVKIDRFCSLDFEGFRDIIDIMGGIDIELTKQEAQHINRLLVELDAAFIEGSIKPFNSPLLKEVDGIHHLNGAQALQYARSRKVPTAEGEHDDYARTLRQRRVLALVLEKLKSCNLQQIISIVEKAGPYVNTNFKKNEIITLTKNSPKYLKYEFAEYRVPEDKNYEGRNINGASVLVIKDLNKSRYNLAKFIYEDSVKENLNGATSSTSSAKTADSSTPTQVTTEKALSAKSNAESAKKNSSENKSQAAKKTSETTKKSQSASVTAKKTAETATKSKDSSETKKTSSTVSKSTSSDSKNTKNTQKAASDVSKVNEKTKSSATVQGAKAATSQTNVKESSSNKTSQNVQSKNSKK